MANYKVDKSIDSESRVTNFIDVGIHEDVLLKDVEYKVSTQGNQYLVFHFEKDGKALSHTEWEPSDDDPQKLENKTNNQIKRIKHIVTKFIPEDQYIIDVEDFKAFCESTLNLLGQNYLEKLVRLKVVYNFNNYTSLPNYTPFIEKMEVTKDKSRLEIISIDKMTRDRPDVEQTQTNPFEVKTENSKAGDLPF